MSYITGSTDPGNTASSFSFCLPDPSDIGGVVNRASGMASQEEENVDIQSFSRPPSSGWSYGLWLLYYASSLGYQTVLSKPLQPRRTTFEIKNLLKYHPPRTIPSSTPAPVVPIVIIPVQGDVQVTVTGIATLVIPSQTPGEPFALPPRLPELGSKESIGPPLAYPELAAMSRCTSSHILSRVSESGSSTLKTMIVRLDI